MTKGERELLRKGYGFSGDYFSSSQMRLDEARKAAKAKAAEYRAEGHRARVVEKTYAGRVTSAIGISVWVKRTEPQP